MRRLAALVAVGVLGIACGGCGTDLPSAGEQPSDDITQPTAQRPGPKKRVLFDREWVVEEGVWFIAAQDRFPSHFERATAGQANGLLGAGDRGALWINTPAMYGKFSVRIELHDHEPRVPGWCEDAVEVSYHARRSPLVMGSFESFSRPLDVRPGEYRVRYCVRGLDATAAETAESEFDGDDYRLYTGGHLLQLWPAPPSPDKVLRQGSDFAASQVPH